MSKTPTLSSVIVELTPHFTKYVNNHIDNNNGSLHKHICLDYLKALHNVKYSKFYPWALSHINDLLMHSKTTIRGPSLRLLTSVLGGDHENDDSSDEIIRKLLLNTMEVLKCNDIFFQDESLFEIISILCIYFAKRRNGEIKLLVGKLIGVSNYEALNLGFSTKRREILISVVGVLASKYPLTDNLLGGCLKIAMKLSDDKDLSDSIDEFYANLEASIENPEQLQMISNAKNKVSNLETYKSAKRIKLS